MAVETKIVCLEGYEPVHRGTDLPRARAHVPAPELQVALVRIRPIRIQVEERVHATREAATLATEVSVEVGMHFQVASW